jgi:enamine deaminase RidA (YjgF/YER057c/UK114 family)
MRSSVQAAHPLDRAATQCDVRVIESSHAAEIYLTATPGPGSQHEQARALYSAVGRTLREHEAMIVQERLFASPQGLASALLARSAALGALDDGVGPTLLTPALGLERAILGVQVHAVRGVSRPVVLEHGMTPVARRFSCSGTDYLFATGLQAASAGDGAAQARHVFKAAESLLGRSGASWADVARSWIWMDDILAWYDQLNQVRTAFFRDRGLMASPGRMPASTGIGVSPAGTGVHIALDLIAAWGDAACVERFSAVGNQRSAYEYGSAFARAARVRTPGGVTVFCSGTAAINAAGRTCFAGDGAGQVAMTLDNVLAVLRDTGCAPTDVVQAMAYCATPAVGDHFLESHRPGLPWPCLTMIGDVCRGDLLFEVEVTACPGARSEGRQGRD